MSIIVFWKKIVTTKSERLATISLVISLKETDTNFRELRMRREALQKQFENILSWQVCRVCEINTNESLYKLLIILWFWRLRVGSGDAIF